MSREGDKLLTTKEVAEELRVSERLVTKWIAKGQLPAIKFERAYRIYRSDLDAFIAQRRTKKEN